MASNRNSANWLKNHHDFVIERIQRCEKKLTDLDPKVLTILLSDPENCHKLSHRMLEDIQESEKHSKILKADCVVNATGLDDMNCGVGIRNLPDEIFRKVSNLNERCFQYMKTSQIAQLGAGDEDEKCQNYPLNEKTVMANGSQISGKCFDGTLANSSEGQSEDGSISIHRAWPTLPKDILASIDPENLGKLGNEWPYIPATHKEQLFAKAEKCESLPEGILAFHGDLEISSECFINLNPKNQVHAIIYSRLKDDAFAKLREDHVSHWKLGDATGLKVLDMAFHVSNLSSLIKNMSSGHQESHACSSIGAFSELKELQAIQLFGEKNCFNAMEGIMGGGNVSLQDLNELQPRVQKMVNMNEIVMGFGDSDYSRMEPETFKTLQNSSNMCELMTVDQMDKLPQDCLKVIGENCLASIKFHGQLTKKHLDSVPVSSFAALDADVISKIPRDALSAEQFGQASSEVVDLAKHHAALWNANVVSGLSPSDIKHVHLSAWNAAPKEAYGGFTNENFSAVPAANMVDMTYEKLAAVPAEVRETLTEDQAKEVGKNVGTTVPTQNPLLAFKELKLSEEAQKVIDGRTNNDPVKNYGE